MTGGPLSLISTLTGRGGCCGSSPRPSYCVRIEWTTRCSFVLAQETPVKTEESPRDSVPTNELPWES